jgi:cell division protein FtsB
MDRGGTSMNSLEKRIGCAQAGRRPAAGQRGMTTVGFLILAVFIGLFAFAFIRLTPVYLNYMKVAGVLEGVHKEFDSQNASRNAIRTSISRRFDVESVSEISANDVKVTTDSNGFLVKATYDHSAPFIGNVSFTVHFDKEVLVRR